ncbi:protein NO VEIN domain-containing protein [Leptolyngbya sp. Cla-17]|uniref:protein NO VEIN domain-containing protein n=1 Tax=Leptolyngbya sp. Cla-17 TaxID=2803751 RepID=UPI001F5C1A22|nr:DUF3883 domain-containing protein [Leptolyngbya sp. Cla-17]
MGLVLMFDTFEADGRDRFIEVKTTAYGKQVPFFVSQNEVMVPRITAIIPSIPCVSIPG